MSKEEIHVETLLRYLGIAAEKTGVKWRARCPNPNHDDSDPSWSIIDKPGDRKHGGHYCFSCHWGGGPWELLAAVLDVSLEEAGKRIKEIGFGDRPVPKKTPGVRVVEYKATDQYRMPIGVVIPGSGGAWFEPALDYLLGRGIPREQIDRWGLGFAVRGRYRNRVIVPAKNRSQELLTITARSIVAAVKPRYRQGEVSMGARPRRALCGEDRFGGYDFITVAEGSFSAMALERAGAPNCCAIFGSELTEEKAREIGKFRRILVATDPDAAGEKIASKLAVLSRRSAVYNLPLDWSPDDAPDDALRERVADGIFRLDTMVQQTV